MGKQKHYVQKPYRVSFNSVESQESEGNSI